MKVKKSCFLFVFFVIYYGDFIDMCKFLFYRCEIVFVIYLGEYSVKVVCRELLDLVNFI